MESNFLYKSEWILYELNQKSVLSDAEYKQLSPRGRWPSVLYGLSKVHKAVVNNKTKNNVQFSQRLMHPLTTFQNGLLNFEIFIIFYFIFRNRKNIFLTKKSTFCPYDHPYDSLFSPRILKLLKRCFFTFCYFYCRNLHFYKNPKKWRFL